jgi:hypothetical protein
MLPLQQNVDDKNDRRESGSSTVASTVEPLEIEHGDESEQEMIGLVSSADIGQTAKRSRKQNILIIAIFISIVVLLSISLLLQSPYSSSSNANTSAYCFPKELFHRVYDAKDFENDCHVTPPYWEDVDENKELLGLQQEQPQNQSISSSIPHLGPCYLPKQKLDWQQLMEENSSIESATNIQYINVVQRHQDSSDSSGLGTTSQEDLSGLCRPGFIIIGAGKCGTSSLYQYLVGHPRVLPAKDKQIHYFKYWSFRPMKWYLSNFPPAKTFLSHGALMTGEASPGYLVRHRSLFVLHVFCCLR